MPLTLPTTRRPRRLLRLSPLLLGLLVATGCVKDTVKDLFAAPDAVTFTQPGLYPEGVAYDLASRSFLVSSQTRGAIGAVLDNGTYRVFADDPRLISTLGVKVDDLRRRVLVAVGDPGYDKARTSPATQGKLAAVAIFDRYSGQLTGYVDLGGLRPGGAGHLANDLTVDPLGNVYVTDSFAPIIYKIDPQGRASVLLEDSRLAAPASAFGLNGIVYHPGGYLLVAKSDEGILFKVPLSDPAAFTEVATDANLKGADGIQLQDANTLLVTANFQSKVYRVNSDNNWASAAATATFGTPPVFPTTLARRGLFAYVLYSHLNALQAGQEPPVAEFSVNKVQF